MLKYATIVSVLLATFLCCSEGKVFDRCEIARDLLRYKVPRSQIGTWLCIAKHESEYDNTKVNQNTGDHGVFQISQIYWCSESNVPGKACKTTCSKFRDDDLRDDIDCIKQIYEEHQRLSGNGFNAWVVYPQHCTGDTSSYVQGCI